jgi:hypothetical protein
MEKLVMQHATFAEHWAWNQNNQSLFRQYYVRRVLAARNQFKQQVLIELLEGTMHNYFKWVDVMLCSKKDWGQLVSQMVKYKMKAENYWWNRVKIAISSMHSRSMKQLNVRTIKRRLRILNLNQKISMKDLQQPLIYTNNIPFFVCVFFPSAV